MQLTSSMQNMQSAHICTDRMKVYLSRMYGGGQERGYTELRETLYFNNTEITEIAGAQVHTSREWR